MRWIEKNIEPYDVLTGDEAFMTGTPFCILPVTSLNGVQIDEGRMGPITRKLLNTWSDHVGVDIEGQIKKWDQDRKAVSTSAPSPYSFKSK
jgi:branched-chain amino acid aminotransferase